MKIFALNLCLDFINKETAENYSFEPISFDELMGHLFKGSDFEEQQYYVKAENSEAYQQYVFELQTNEIWRNLKINISFVFPSEGQKEQFLEGYVDRFRLVDAAGGIVLNGKEQVLFIYNRQRWTLPKGGVEWREEIEAAAVREVREETGLEVVKLKEKIGISYHTFRRGKHWVMKATHWFLMQADSEAILEPPADENIEELRWMDRKEWLEVAPESFPMVRHIMEWAYQHKLG